MASGIRCHPETKSLWKKFKADQGKKFGEPSKDYYSKESIAEALADKESEMYQQFVSDLPKLNYLIMYIKDEKLIDFHSVGSVDVGNNSKSASEAMAEILGKERACRYVTFKFDYMSADGRRQNKCVGFHWNPADGPAKLKMISASSESEFRKSLDGLDKLPGAEDTGDIKDLLDSIAKS